MQKPDHPTGKKKQRGGKKRGGVTAAACLSFLPSLVRTEAPGKKEKKENPG